MEQQVKKKILIIDDEPTFVKMISARLSANGYEVVTASDGEAGLRLIEVEKPNLIVLDVMMPMMDGYTFIRELKGTREENPIPVIVLTAKERMEDLFKVEGVDDYMLKPYEPSELLQKIKKHIG